MFKDTNSLMAVYLTFAVGLLARPLGAILFGWLGDTISRTLALNLSTFSMAAPTFLIGLLPGYQHIGSLAPLLLVVLRFMQGVCAGGQYSGALTLSFENAPSHRRAVNCSYNHITSMLGYGLAILISLISFHLLHNHKQSLAWRLPFLISPLLMIIYYQLTRRWQELFAATKSSSTKNHRQKSPIKNLSKKYRRNLLLSTLLASCGGIFYFTLFVYMTSFLILQANLSMQQTFTINAISLITSCITVLLCAKLADRIGVHTFAMTTTTFIFFASVLFTKITFTYITSTALFIILMTTLNSGFIAASAPIYPQIFPHYIRYTGTSISYNLGNGLFGGSAPFIATWLVHHQGPAGLAKLLMITSLVTLAVLNLVQKNQYALKTSLSHHNT